jgi:peptidoglycan/LPS O-acetylase OafA/YrhL
MPAIDGLRALAVTAVFLYHADSSWLPGGFLGVDVFFVISGYLITSLLIAELDQTGRVALLRFWAGRARRLLPALFLLLAVCLIVGATVERGKVVGLPGDALSALFYYSNWHFVFGHESYFTQFGRPGMLRHMWSLAVEEQFYLLWPPLFLVVMWISRRLLVPILVAAAAVGSTALMWELYQPGTDTSRIFYGTDTRAAPLLVGVLLAFVWKPSSLPTTRRPRAPRWIGPLSLAALGAVIYMFVAVHDYDERLYRGGFLVLAVCAAVLLATLVHPASLLGRVFAHPLPRWIGERSYGIYLWHWPILVFTRPGVDVHLARGILIPAQAAGTVIVAAVSYRFLEQPIRSGGLRRLRPRRPRLLAQPRTPFAIATAGIAGLLALVALTPSGVAALPPGFNSGTLARSQHASKHLVLPPGRHHHAASVQTQHTVTTSSATPGHHHHAKPSPPPAHRAPPIPTSGPILAVGDSVMLGASSALGSALGPELHIDAVISRQPEETIARLFAYRADGSLPRRVIVHIGDNGPVYYADVLRLKQALAGVPLVVLVNVRIDTSWQGEVNSELAYAVKGWHEATIADWYDASSGPGLLADGTHTTRDGARDFAAVIARAIHHPVLGGVTH